MSKSSRCYYHPSKKAVIRCKKCGKSICKSDLRVYKRQRSSGMNEFERRWVEKEDYCVVCYSKKMSSDSRSMLVLLVLMPVFALAFLNYVPDFANREIFVLFFAFAGFLILLQILVTWRRARKTRKAASKLRRK